VQRLHLFGLSYEASRETSRAYLDKVHAQFIPEMEETADEHPEEDIQSAV